MFDEFIRRLSKRYGTEDKCVLESREFWGGDYSGDNTLAQDAHWRDRGIFKDEARWHKLGEENHEMLVKYSSLLNLHFPVRQILEWGCGGGANAVHFAPKANEFIGVDITSESLRECGRQVARCGLDNFRPVLVDAAHPESILSDDTIRPDVFICTYVYELLPGPGYGLDLLNIAHKLLTGDGTAFIQIRYNDGRKKAYSRVRRYGADPYHATTYTIEEFWNASIDCGFEPVGVILKPKQPLVNDQHYAYFFLKKR